MSKAIAIDGSSGQGSRTAKLLEELGIQIFHLADADGIKKGRKAILDSNTIVFATPTHWFNVSAFGSMSAHR